MFYKWSAKISLFIGCLLIFLAGSVRAQENGGKKNVRPGETVHKSEVDDSAAAKPIYFYDFERAEFTVPKIHIEHDENGKGIIRFSKKYIDDEITDPIQLSKSTLEKLRTHWGNLNFLDSTEDYQYEKDYSHLGQIKVTMNKAGRTRTAEFNWTTNVDARALSDEYRRIANQFIWMFDIGVSRENQPLESARILRALDIQLKRNEIADPEQIIPLLKEIGDDERLPLVSRNFATRVLKRIEDEIAKKKDN